MSFDRPKSLGNPDESVDWVLITFYDVFLGNGAEFAFNCGHGAVHDKIEVGDIVEEEFLVSTELFLAKPW